MPSGTNDFEVPTGLTELLQEFTVAVLRGQPTDLLKFAKEFFDSKFHGIPNEDEDDGKLLSTDLIILFISVSGLGVAFKQNERAQLIWKSKNAICISS